mgnify:CR=1 FL=1
MTSELLLSMREPTRESGVVILPVSGETDTNVRMGRDLDRFLEETRAEEARREQEKQQLIRQFCLIASEAADIAWTKYGHLMNNE